MLWLFLGLVSDPNTVVGEGSSSTSSFPSTASSVPPASSSSPSPSLREEAFGVLKAFFRCSAAFSRICISRSDSVSRLARKACLSASIMDFRPCSWAFTSSTTYPAPMESLS